MFCKWSKWSEAIESYGGSLHQVAKCEECGKIKRRLAVSIAVAQLSSKQVNDVLSKGDSK